MKKSQKIASLAVAFIILLGLLLATFTTMAQTTRLRKGDKAPNLEFKSPADKTYKLSDLQGKMVYIDFWASWCFPCRKANPMLVKVYKKFKNAKFRTGEKGFAIYSVALERPNQMQRWQNAIKQDGLIWEEHVSDFKYWQSEPAAIYGVRAIPQGYLLDGNGIIIGRYQHPDDIAYELEKRVKK